MTLGRNDWFTRLYLYGLDLIEGFSELPQERFRQQTNLCHFMRVILIHIPVIWGMRLATASFTLYIFLWYPAKTFGIYYLYFWIWLIVPGGVIWLIAWIVRHLHWIKVAEHESVPLRLIKEFVKAKKASICPVIEIGEHSDV